MVAGMSCRYDKMAAKTPKAAGKVETTQPIVDLARDEDEEDKDGGGDKVDKKGKGKEREEEADGREGFEGDGWEEGEVERGMLHALVELGNLEMLLHQVRGCSFSSWRFVAVKHYCFCLFVRLVLRHCYDTAETYPMLRDVSCPCFRWRFRQRVIVCVVACCCDCN